jgi:hypothetical protein
MVGLFAEQLRSALRRLYSPDTTDQDAATFVERGIIK